MQRPDEIPEEHHAWVAVYEYLRPRRRIDWLSVAIWGALALFTLAFWAAIAWAIVTGMVL